jgi:uncharacterized protein (TIGR03000 family)
MVAIVSALAVRPALGQSTGGHYYETYQYGYNPGYYARRYPAPPVFVVPSKMAPSFTPYMYYVPAPKRVSSKSLGASGFAVRILPEGGRLALTDTSAWIELQVPADARVWFGGEETTQKGTLRQFVSPPLAPGRQYTYEVRASWKEGGREVTESRRLNLGAGNRLSASFPLVANNLATGKSVSSPP